MTRFRQPYFSWRSSSNRHPVDDAGVAGNAIATLPPAQRAGSDEHARVTPQPTNLPRRRSRPDEESFPVVEPTIRASLFTLYTDKCTAYAETVSTLTREAVVAAAVALADEEGLDGVSLRRLGDRLDVSAMAPYRHVRGKDDLLDAMAEELYGRHRAPCSRE